MAHHKRHRAKAQRAGCYCGSKLSKAHAPALRSSGSKSGGSHGYQLRLRVRALEAA
jgi:hypothetical protein